MTEFAPEQILYNGRFLTVDDRFSTASAVAIYGGRIVAVGDDDEVRALAGRSTKATDLKGRCVIPGQVDGYAHFISSGADLLGDRGKVNIITLQSVDAIVSAIRECAAKLQPGEWIGTSCMYRGTLEEGRWPTRADLDAAAPDNPVHLMQGGRPIIANSRALELAGIGRDTPNPTDPPGVIVRDADGEPTGQLIGGAADMARRAWAADIGESPEHWDFSFFDRAALVDAMLTQQSILHSCGVTTLRDSGTTRREVDALIHARDTGVLKVRTGMALLLPDTLVSAGEASPLYESFFGPWTLGSDLLWTWGVTMTYTLDGWEIVDRDALRYCINEAARRGWTLAITPSIGGSPEPVSQVLTFIEELDERDVVGELRWALFHPEALREPEDIARCARLGITVNPNPLLNYHAAARSLHMHEQVKASGLHHGVEDDAMAQTRSMWGMSTRDWIDAGLVVSTGSNTPAAIYDPEQPFLGHYCLLTGDTLAGKLMPGQEIDREDMLRAFTRNGAHALHRDRQIGSIEAGKYADLVVVDHDLLTCDAREVAETKVLATYVGGELVYER